MPPPSQQRSSSQPQQPTIPTSIPDNRLGLDPDDVQTLRRLQQAAHAQARSPAGSQASSQGRLLLDPGSLQLLSRHFDLVMQAIAQRLDQLNQQTEIATQAQTDRAGNALRVADAEIARFRLMMQQIDQLEMEFEKIQRIRDIVRTWRARVEDMERRLG
ncbi:uncharacterized protein LTR77_000140 [Saxophila tyrrhenica]|uniref:Biogenesis of lysosome-related organelles complex 1 subunit CNL1 n=1 Tax=Saxophila tyrrhenica TaxID=1690608 RepID=A0AAV9PM65_9PEZI|nr:hypothetical protein LTR77_000140 [Saxophila tyrrhenica]